MTRYWWDADTQSFTDEPPRRFQPFGQAPAIITDTIDPYYHPGTCKFVDSKSRLKDMDKACGTITTDKIQPSDSSWRKQKQKELADDHHKALHKAVAQLEAGTAPLTEETRELCTRENHRISSALGVDAFNVVGRKNDKRGKRYRRR